MRPTTQALPVLLILCCCGRLEAQPSEHPPVLVLQAPPAASVDSVSLSPDGTIVAAGASEGGVRLYDAKTGALRLAIKEAGDRSVAFSPDGRTLAAAGYHMDKLIGIYDVRTGRRLRNLAGHTEWETYAAAFSPDGKLLASAGSDRQVLVWDLATGSMRRLGDATARVTALAFSPDGTTLAAGGSDRVVRLWDPGTGTLRRSLEGHGNWICAVAFSADGRTLASASCAWASRGGVDWPRPASRDAEQSEWRLWDAATGSLKRTLIEPGRLLSLAFSPDGQSLACAIERDVRVYDLKNAGAPGRVVLRHDADVTGVAWAPDGRTITSGSIDQTVRRVDATTGAVLWRAPGSFEQVNSVAVSPDGSLLVTGSSDRRFALRLLKTTARELGPGALRLWDARRGRLLRRLGNPADQVMAVAISPDGRRVAAGGARPDGAGFVRLWDAASAGEVWAKADHGAEVLAVAFAPDGSTAASASADGLVTLRDPATGAALRSLAGHRGGATSLVFSRDGALLVCGEGHGGIRVWDAPSGRLLQTCKAADSRAESEPRDRLITSVALSPDASTFLACTASMGNTYGEPVRLWDTKTGALRRDYSEPRISGRPIAASPDGTILAAGGKTIQLWDTRTGAPLRRLGGHLKKTQSLAFSADGRVLYSGGNYGTTNAWEVATGRHLITLFAFPEVRDGQIADEWLAYRPDGFYDGSAGIDRYLSWRVGDDLLTPQSLGPRLRRPDRVADALKLSQLE